MKTKIFLLSAALMLGSLIAGIAQTTPHDSIHVKIMKNENGVITDIDTAVAFAQHDALVLWLEAQGIELPPPPPPMPGDSMRQFMIVREMEMDSMANGERMGIPPPPLPPREPLPPGSRETFIMRTPPPPPAPGEEIMIIVCDSAHKKECRKVIMVDEKNPGTTKTRVVTKDVSAANELVVYPNPSSGNITVEINMPGKEKADLTITDMNGKTVFTEQLASEGKIIKQIDLSKNGKGVYSIRLSKGGKVIVEQVVIE